MRKLVSILLLLLFLWGARYTYADRWALLIGVDKCEALGKLTVCSADARAMKEVLQKVGYRDGQIKLLTDDVTSPRDWPSTGNIKRNVQYLAEVAEPNDTILLFFSGHGVTRDGEGYLVPVDGDRDNAVSLGWIKSQLAVSKARQKVLILDACHAGAAKGVTGIAPSLRAAEGMVMLLSCEDGQVSWPDQKKGHSVFTSYLLEGLEGKAAGEDRKVTLVEAFEYARKRVKQWTFQNGKPLQSPVLVGRADSGVALAECPPEDVVAETPGVVPQPPPATLRIQPGFRATDWGGEIQRVKVATVDTVGWKEITYYTNTIGMRFVAIPASEFLMGSEPTETGRYNDEGPQHKVQITKAFFMGATEVTQYQYQFVMNQGSISSDASNLPAENITWRQASEFCRRLSEREGVVYRLPTEAEWELVCRAGTNTRYYFGDSDDDFYKFGNYADHGSNQKWSDEDHIDGHSTSAPVGSFPANSWGLWDMVGNVAEWCFDKYADNFYREEEGRDPQGPPLGLDRVFRGGSWCSSRATCRSAARNRASPDSCKPGLGFRVVRCKE